MPLTINCKYEEFEKIKNKKEKYLFCSCSIKNSLMIYPYKYGNMPILVGKYGTHQRIPLTVIPTITHHKGKGVWKLSII